VRSTRPVAAVVLAAGEGTRMKSAVPKVLHEVAGRSLLWHAVTAAQSLRPDQLVVVVRHGRDAVVEHLGLQAPEALIAEQDAIPGTGRATQCGLAVAGSPESGTVIVTYGDVPLLTPATLAELAEVHSRGGNAVTVLTAHVADPTGYGRIVRSPVDGSVARIVEQKDATDAEAAITEINTGIYAFDAAVLTDALGRIGRDNAAAELYLTDVVGLAGADGGRVEAVVLADPREAEGVNDRVQLAALGRLLRSRICEAWMRAGVTVVDPETTWIDVDVRVEPDVVLLPGTQLLGRTEIRSGATIGPDTTLRDCEIGERTTVVRSHAAGAVIGPDAAVGPYSYLRAGTVLGAGGKIGAFVETKNAEIGAGSKVPHLTYVGDATIGTGTNIGAATVFVNYDGETKHSTVVGDHVRIGSDTMLVAPITVGDGAYTAAGSVITQDVPPGALGIGRATTRMIERWVDRKRAGSRSASAAAEARARAARDAEGQGQ
jgi:bifunctional UDP-N-acetylglucosamine pyrophosphorylase / glucosamine-1-phosphate N-acetyltransferase